jgi:hypothetical protein
MKTVLVCGGRDFNDWEAMNEALCYHASDADKIIHGGAQGADNLSGQWAKAAGIPCRVFKADWMKYKKAAGPIRNQRMIDEGKPNLVIAFQGGKGTRDMLNRARKALVTIIQITPSAQPVTESNQ